MSDTPQPLRRPTSIDEMLERIRNFRTPAARAAVEHLVVRPGDVFIATYSKSGTTWMQQVVHGLRSAGSMEFREISEVVPWLESAVDMGIDPSADQMWSPRAFKSHLMWRDLPKGGRYITVFRDPFTVLPSFYRFFEGWWFEEGTVSLEEFAERFYIAGSAAGRHWDHLIDWWPVVGDPGVLALTYEDMLEAPQRVPAVVADFLEMDVARPVLERVVAQSSREFMAEHADQFDEQLIRGARDHVWGLLSGGSAAKVNAARPALELSDQLRRALDAVWEQTVGAALGFGDYASFRAALPDPLGVRS